MSEPNTTRGSGWVWHTLRKPFIRYSLFALAGVAAFVVVVGGFTTTVEATNTLEFCTSCHTMSYNFEEYKKTIHYSNPSGVRAVCSDCHVPKKNWFSEMRRKLVAASDVWAEIVGTIDTKEKFDAHRMEMAKREWARMKESDSIGCRNCHSFESMDMEEQDKRAKNQHTDAVMADSGKTCIDCHKGIAHRLPRVQ
ncbi:MAG: NapC/NirT family cytochrome c [Gammaproteobacteria bacterium]|nr:NapC/NirT family cytochrome c [Gammaproteobacteria bacterium]MBU1481590.1 NapC/NirT family cytochrome c [Gammaproteobacteria bacterium]